MLHVRLVIRALRGTISLVTRAIIIDRKRKRRGSMKIFRVKRPYYKDLLEPSAVIFSAALNSHVIYFHIVYRVIFAKGIPCSSAK
jgi:hypothetical protein